MLCTGDAAVNGPRNKLLDANIANWPDVLDKALALKPLDVLPGHGAAGGPEILTGQPRFLRIFTGKLRFKRMQGRRRLRCISSCRTTIAIGFRIDQMDCNRISRLFTLN